MSNFIMTETSIYTTMVENSRYLEINLMFNVQSLVLLPPSIIEACSVVICKRLNNKEEERIAKSILNFLRNEQSQYLMDLKPPDAIFIDKERISKPIHILIPEYPTPLISDEQLSIIQAPFIDKILSNVIREKTSDILSIQDDEGLNYNSKILIQDLKRFPFEFQSEREIRLNINSKTITDNLDDLVKNKWLYRYENKISLGKGKGQFQPYVFTEKAIQEIGKQEIKGKGSIEHAFWQYRCAKYFTEKGYNIEIEYFPFEENNTDKNQSSLSSIDVVAQNNYEKIALEIELRDIPHIKDNIKKCINAGFDNIIIAVYGSKLMKRIQSIVLSNIESEKYTKEGKIKIEMLSSFLNLKNI